MSRVAVAGFRGAAGRSPGTPPGGGPPALVNHYSALTSTNASTNNVTGVTAASGNVMVMMGSLNVGNTTRIITAITDPGSNTWTKQQGVTGVGGNATRVEIWTAPVTNGFSSGTVAISSGAQTLDGLFDVSVWSGVTLTGVLSNAVGAAGINSPACTVTTTGAAAVLSNMTYSNVNPPTTGPGAGYTVLTSGTSGALDYGQAAYQIVSTAGTYGPAWTQTAGANWGIATIALPSL